METPVQFIVKLPIKITKKKKWVVASCPILDVHSQGNTEKKARNNLIEALSLFLVSCFDRGSLDTVLKQCGFKAIHQQAAPRTSSLSKEDYVSVPVPFIVNQQSAQCHA